MNDLVLYDMQHLYEDEGTGNTNHSVLYGVQHPYKDDGLLAHISENVWLHGETMSMED